jgi:ubiquinone/menaquinone biosynthesis C-methylase UbiE
MNLKERVSREKKSHTENDVLGESLKLKNRFHHILIYPSYNRMLLALEKAYLNTNSLKVLDYGCGKGLDSLKLLKSGAKTYGIDISEEYIELTKQLALENNFQEKDFKFQVMDAHNLKFESNSFDLVIGRAILHHLDANTALKSIHKVLKPNGRAIFIEPLADNPLLKLFRALTPKARTIDEAPFSRSDLKKLINPEFWDNKDSIYCGLISAPTAMFTSIFLSKYPNNILLKISDAIEKKLNKYDFFKYKNQYVLLDLQKK